MGLLGKEIKHPLLGIVHYSKRRGSKCIRVSVTRNGRVRVTLPLFTSFATAIGFVEKNSTKIMATLERITRQEASRISISDIETGGLEHIRQRARSTLPERLKELSGRMNERFIITDSAGRCIEKPFTYKRVAIKNNRSNWGSCSTAGNINLNMHLISLPDKLRDFVILHELCHLVYPNHGKEFHNLLDKACGGMEKEYSKELRKYRLS